jgi:hypothetical protein
MNAAHWSSVRWIGVPCIVLVACLLSGCELGSRTVVPEYYTIDYHVSQTPSGGVIVSAQRGQSDLPDGIEIDVLVTRASSAGAAVDQAVLIGSTEEQPLSKPVKNGGFTISATRVLVNSCGLQPPCGPFPAGEYHLLIDVRTPDTAVVGGGGGNGFGGFGADQISVLDDPRYLSQTHGVHQFPGLEIFKPVQLSAIQSCLDGQGGQHDTGGCSG